VELRYGGEEHLVCAKTGNQLMYMNDFLRDPCFVKISRSSHPEDSADNKQEWHRNRKREVGFVPSVE